MRLQCRSSPLRRSQSLAAHPSRNVHAAPSFTTSHSHSHTHRVIKRSKNYAEEGTACGLPTCGCAPPSPPPLPTTPHPPPPAPSPPPHHHRSPPPPPSPPCCHHLGVRATLEILERARQAGFTDMKVGVSLVSGGGCGPKRWQSGSARGEEPRVGSVAGQVRAGAEGGECGGMVNSSVTHSRPSPGHLVLRRMRERSTARVRCGQPRNECRGAAGSAGGPGQVIGGGVGPCVTWGNSGPHRTAPPSLLLPSPRRRAPPLSAR